MFSEPLFSRRGAEAQSSQAIGAKTRLADRAAPIVLGFLALAGTMLGWNKGQLPQRAEINAPPFRGEDIAPDLALYRDVIAEVRSGKNYYAVARQRIPHYGFPIASPLNWRLPTYAWLFSWLPGPPWIQAALVLLSIAALGLAFTAQLRTISIGYAVLTTFLLFGVVRWAVDGHAYLAQETWAATLIILSLSAHAMAVQGDSELGTRNGRMGWRWLSVAAGIGALLFRELALPYCGVAWLLAIWTRRWREAAAWTTGIALFFAFFAWHVAQVNAQLIGIEVAASGGLSQWLRFGGLDFVLLTTRMNSLLFAAPGFLLWLYIILSLVGLSRGRDETSDLSCLAALSYLIAFAVLGRPENFYWGLLPAPLLAWGLARAPQWLAEAFVASGGRIASPAR